MRQPRLLAPLLLVIGCGTNASPERVSVPPGSSFSAVTDSLAAHGVIGNRLWFTLLARVRGADRAVRAGAYEFAPRLNAWRVLDILAEGGRRPADSPSPKASPSSTWRRSPGSGSAFPAMQSSRPRATAQLPPPRWASRCARSKDSSGPRPTPFRSR